MKAAPGAVEFVSQVLDARFKLGLIVEKMYDQGFNDGLYSRSCRKAFLSK